MALIASLQAAPHRSEAIVPDVRITNDNTTGSLMRHDGGTDAYLQRCSTSRRIQNEPTVAVDPRDPNIIVVGAHAYCPIDPVVVPLGYYRSTDGGLTWQGSLLPGYPGDPSPAGKALPAACKDRSDPTLDFDNQGRLFYGFFCTRPTIVGFSSILAVAVYDHDGAHYVGTTIVASFPSSNAIIFDDKVNLVVDRSGGPSDGSVYFSWVKALVAVTIPVLQVARSTDHGHTFSTPTSLLAIAGSATFPDLAVGPDGAVYVAYRTSIPDAIWVAKSSDGTKTFLPGQLVALLVRPFDSANFEPTNVTFIDCGDGPDECMNGYTYGRFVSYASVAADAAGVHVIYQTMVRGQSKLFSRTSADGILWTRPAQTIDNRIRGHQWHHDLASAEGMLTAVFYDSRADPGYAPNRPPGNTAGGSNSGPAVDVFVARSSNGGRTWTETKVNSVGFNLNYEVAHDRRTPFYGDYSYVSAVRGGVFVVWTDARDIVPGVDPRENGAADDHDGFDVYAPCVYKPSGIQAAVYVTPKYDDPCLDLGGMDFNIYGARIG